MFNPPLVGWIQTPIQIRFRGGQNQVRWIQGRVHSENCYQIQPIIDPSYSHGESQNHWFWEQHNASNIRCIIRGESVNAPNVDCKKVDRD